jgi:hypothetical protein
MPRADCAADWPCEVLPRAVVVYRSYCTSLKGDRGMSSCESLRSSQKEKPAPKYEAAPAKSAGGKPATGRLCQAGLRTSRASVRHTRPATTGYCSKCSQKFAINRRVDSSLRRGFAAQGGDNSEQLAGATEVTPSDIFRGELRQTFGIDIIVAERRHVPFEIEISQQAVMFTPISGLPSPRLKHILPNFGWRDQTG